MMTYKLYKGFSIVELMVAITIGLLLVAGASTVWVSSKTNFAIQRDLADIQEAGRFAITWLQRDIRGAGYFGCNGGDQITNEVTGGDVASNLADISNIIEGKEKGSASWQIVTTAWEPSEQMGLDDTLLALSGNNEMVNGSDAITIRGFNFNGYGVVDAVPRSSRTFDLESAPGFRADQIVGLMDCTGGTIFQINADTADESITIKASDFLAREAKGELVDNSGASLDPKRFPSYVYPYTAYRYYVRPFHATNNPNGPSLWRVSLTRSTLAFNEEMLPGVDTMQVLYGEYADATKVYRSAANVVNWSAVKSIKIGLLLRSLNEYGSDVDSSPFQVLDALIPAANDKRRRKVFTTEIAIRNK